MSVPMKKHPIKGIKVQIGNKKQRLFILPSDEAKGLIQMLHKYEVQDSIDWRLSLNDILDKYSEGGGALKGERLLLEMTQVELAKKLHVPQHVVSEMENGKRPIGKKMAMRLAKILKTDYRIFL